MGLGGSSNMSEVFENNKSFEDSGRSDEEHSEDGGSSKDGGSETPHERRHHKDYGCLRLKKSMMAAKGSDMAEFNKPKCDVHQVGDEREVEVLRSFNYPPSELITDDGVLPERGYSQFNDVSLRYLVSKVS
nr:hypothetical protein [Tanacetum cinerariifolium]